MLQADTLREYFGTRELFVLNKWVRDVGASWREVG